MSGASKYKASLVGKAATFIALGVAAGAAEVIVRFFLARESVPPGHLVLAFVANAAVLGTLSLGVGFSSLAVVRVVNRGLSSLKFSWRASPQDVATAAAFAAAILATETLGLTGRHPAASPFAAAAGLFLAGFVSQRTQSRRKPIGSPRTRVALVMAWGLCLAATSMAARTTHREIDTWLGARSDHPAAPDAPNVVFVVLDTLRADRVGVYGGGNLTPHLDRLAESSLVYSNAISTAPWTLPTHASFFTGLYPAQHGVSWGHYRLEEGPATLAELYRERGYDTFALSNNFLLDRDNGFDRGFHSFLEISRHSKMAAWRFSLSCALLRSISEWIGPGRFAGLDAGSSWSNLLLTEQIDRSLASQRPFLTFVNYFEPHDPYLPPQPFLEQRLTPQQQRAAGQLVQRQEDLCTESCGVHGALTTDNVELLAALYDAEVAYQDAMVGKLIAHLTETGALENTWLIVTSDHGELFGEGGQVFHTAGAHYKLLHLPLIVRPPGGVDATRIDALVQPVDVFATLVGICGADLPDEVDRAIPLPLRTDTYPTRAACISETHGASIPGLFLSQRANLQADLSHWLTWITSVYADGFLLELHNDQPAALFEVTADPRAETNVLEERGDVVRSLLEKLDRHRSRKLTGENS